MALHHVGPGEVADLRPLGSALRATKTAALIKSEHFEAIRLIVPAGREIPWHQVAGNITLHCLEGQVILGLTGTALPLGPGDWLYLGGGEPHFVKGVEDASLLLTIFFAEARGERSQWADEAAIERWENEGGADAVT